MIIRVFGKQQRPHVMISGKADPKKVMYLTFEPTRAAEDITNLRRRLVMAEEHSYHHARPGFVAVEMVDELESILKIERHYVLQEKTGRLERLCRIPDARGCDDCGP